MTPHSGTKSRISQKYKIEKEDDYMDKHKAVVRRGDRCVIDYLNKDEAGELILRAGKKRFSRVVTGSK